MLHILLLEKPKENFNILLFSSIEQTLIFTMPNDYIFSVNGKDSDWLKCKTNFTKEKKFEYTSNFLIKDKAK